MTDERNKKNSCHPLFGASFILGKAIKGEEIYMTSEGKKEDRI